MDKQSTEGNVRAVKQLRGNVRNLLCGATRFEVNQFIYDREQSNDHDAVEFAVEWRDELNKEEPDKATYLRRCHYVDALAVQSACNLSGIVESFATVLKYIWCDARFHKQGTDYVNQHPISRLYAEQINHLSIAMSKGSYMEAHDVVSRKSADILTY